ncbi:MAG TPA: ABC transporter permease [Acidimicrobiia bacterium]|nr:ABC transporter permease [Acidimicrobiia bacterium]
MRVSEGTATKGAVDWILTVNGWAIYLFLYVPILIVMLFSFSDNPNVGIWGGFTLDWYDRMLGNDQLMRALRNSVIVAIVSTVISTILGTAAALALERYRRWLGKRPFDALLYLPVIIPDVTMAVMLLIWFAQLEFRLGLTTILLSHIAFNISFVAIVVRARLANMDDALEEAAADLYASRWQAFRRVTLPLIWPGVIGGGLLALTLSLDDVVVTSFVQGPGATTLPVYVFGLIRRTVTPEINAVSTVMLVASMVLVFISLVFQRRSDNPS